MVESLGSSGDLGPKPFRQVHRSLAFIMVTRRAFVGGAALAAFSADSRYRIGIITNTRGGWEKDVFLSFREARAAGYRNVESFFHYLVDYLDRPADLQKTIDDI